MTKIQNEARFDGASVELYAKFFEIMVTHSNCNSNIFRPLDEIYSEHEKEKQWHNAGHMRGAF